MLLSHSIGLKCLVLFMFLVGRSDGRSSLGGGGGLMSGSGMEDDSPELFRSEEDSQASMLTSMTRGWSVPPLDRSKLVKACGSESGHLVADILGGRPLAFKLSKRQIRTPGSVRNQKFFRAQAALGSSNRRKKLRSIWTMGSGLSKREASRRSLLPEELLESSYENALSRMYQERLEVEVLLPRLKNKKAPTPTVVYSFPIGKGSMSEDGSIVSRGRGTVYVYPNGRKKGQGTTEEPACIEVDSSTLSLTSGPTVTDHAWAKGKKVFWKGRKVGQL